MSMRNKPTAVAAAIALTIAACLPAPIPHGHAARQYTTIARITYYTEAGVMADGNWTYAGAAACSNDLPLGTVVALRGDRYVCEDRGLLTPTWVDLFAPDGASWVPQTYGDWTTIEVEP